MNSIEANCLKMLDTMLEDMRHADPLYRPTDFWSVGGEKIIADIRANGLSRFRSCQSANLFFVPLYLRQYYQAHRDLIDPIVSWLDKLPYRKAGTDILRLLTGHANAFADYRVFRAGDTEGFPSLADVSESEIGHPAEQFVFEGKRYSCSFLNYLRGLVFLKRTVQPQKLARVLEIGGGFGTLGEIMLKSDPGTVYIDVDLPPVAAVSTYYLKEVFGDEAVMGYDETRDWGSIDLDQLPASCRAVVLCPWQLSKLQGAVDLFVNFISFQEMEPNVVGNYINLVQGLQPDYVLFRNLREGKKKKNAPEELGVNEPTTLDQMIQWFDRYRLAARDTISFGELKIDDFHSEIASLVLNQYPGEKEKNERA